MVHPLLRRQLKKAGFDTLCPDDIDLWRAFLESVSRAYQDADQDRYTIERSLTISSDEMQQLNEDLAGEKRVLELIANGAGLTTVLESLASFVEQQSEGVLCSVLLLDESGTRLLHGAAPSLPAVYNEAIDGIEIGPDVGSCGTAAHFGRQVIVTDIASDPLWTNFRDLAMEHGLRACWSTPIFSRGGDTLGTFAMYYQEPRAPRPLDLQLIERATSIGSIAIEATRAAEMIRKREGTLRATIESTEEGILVVDNDGRVTHTNARFAEMWQIPEEVISRGDDDALLTFAIDQLTDPAVFLAKVRELYDSHEESQDTLHFKSGRIFDRYSRPLMIGDATGGRVWSFRDVTERVLADAELKARTEELQTLNQSLTQAHKDIEDSQQQLREYASRLEKTVELEHERAITDAITGLANHRGTLIHLESIIQKASQRKESVSVIMADIDGFKLFNDTYGHTCGDDILRLVATVCRDACDRGGIVCRYGGDEFLMILPGRGRRAARNVAQQITQKLGHSEFVVESGERLPVSLSLGISTLPQDASSMEKLIALADAAMYEAKRSAVHSHTGNSTMVNAGAIDTTFAVLDSLVQAIDAKDRYTKRHSDVVAEYGMKLAAQLSLSDDAQRALRIAGLLHDVGKLAVPDEILKKPGSLTAEEYEIVKRHVVIGEVLIREVPHQIDVIQAVSCHHERFDGSGYPRGLKGTEIPFLGRIIAVADAYSAMILDRPYRKGLAIDRVIGELEEAAGSQLDPELVPLFISLLLEEAGFQAAAA